MEILRIIFGIIFLAHGIVLIVVLIQLAYYSHRRKELNKLTKIMAENPNFYKDKEFLRKIKKYIDVRFEKTAQKTTRKKYKSRGLREE